MPTLKERLAEYFKSLIPTKTVTIVDRRQETTGLSQTIDVDRALGLFGEADAGNPRELFALYTEIVLGDSHLQGEFAKRKLAVLGDALSILPIDKENADDAAAAEAIKAMVADFESSSIESRVQDFGDACLFLLDSVLWPVAIVEKVFRKSAKAGLQYELAELVPVPAHLLDWSEGRLRLCKTDPVTGYVTGGYHEVDPHRYIVHRGHLLTSPDFRGGPFRSLVIWWMFSALSREWWARFLDRYGSPFLVGKYDQADDASRSVLERAFSWAVKIGGLVVSKETEVELQQASSSQSGDAYEKFLAVCQREKSKLILGQTLSSDSQPLGIGGGASKTHEGVRQDVRQWDAAQLGKTLRTQLFRQYLSINGIKGRPPKAVWGGESKEESQVTGALLSSLKSAGLRLTDDGVVTLSERVGLPLERDPGAAVSPAPAAISLGSRLVLASPRLIDADRANEAIARAGAADLAQAFRGALAPVRQILDEAESADEVQARILRAFPDWSAGRVAEVVERALVAFAANGMVR